MSEGSGLEDASVDYVMLFNILHAKEPKKLLKEAYRILKPGGKLGIIHWNYDSKPPLARQWKSDPSLSNASGGRSLWALNLNKNTT